MAAKKKAPAKPKVAKKHPIVVQEWEESERGWGVRPDGASLHLTESDRAAYVKDFWDREKQRNPSSTVPDEYSRTSGSPFVMDVDTKTYNQIKKSKNGVMLWQSEYRELRKGT
jgi:hypothetical protein